MKIIEAPKTQTLVKAFVNKKILIPPYQRFYVWSEVLVKQLLKDIRYGCQYKNNIFLGSIIFKKTEANAYRLIDGQQRTLTLFIILRSLLETNKLSAAQQDLIKTFFQDADIDGGSPIDFNDEVRAKYFKERILLGTQPKHVDLSVVLNIVNAEAEAKSFFKPLKQNEIRKILDYILTGLEFLVINIHKGVFESEIFESINSKRVELNDTDLIKSYIFGRCDDKLSLENSAKELWREFDKQLKREKAVSKFIEIYCLSKTKDEMVSRDHAYYHFF